MTMKIINYITILLLCIVNSACIKQKNLYRGNNNTQKDVINEPDFFYPFANEAIDNTAEITIQIKDDVPLPYNPTAEIPPLKYNKSWILMFIQDDCRQSAFCYTWAAINGKPLTHGSFYDLSHLQVGDLPPNHYYLGKTLGSTDGAGNEVRFSFITTVSAEEDWMNAKSTIFKEGNAFRESKGLVWGNIKEMLNYNVGIAFHDVMTENTDNQESIIAHFKTAQNIILEKLEGRGCKMLAEPNGNKNYVNAAYNYSPIKTLTAQAGAKKIYPFEEGLDLEKTLIERAFFNSHDIILKDIAYETSLPNQERALVYPAAHATDTSWIDFLKWLNDTHGKDGDDSVWMPNQEEYYEYNYYKKHGTVDVTLTDNHSLKLVISLPSQEYFYYPSVTVNLSGINIENIKKITSNNTVTGLSYANYGNGVMLNIDCRKYLAEHAENFVKRYEANPNGIGNKADATYFVNMLKDSDKKEELKKRIQ